MNLEPRNLEPRMPSPFLTAREAAEELGVRLETLYAYVSRGQIRSEQGPGKARRYPREDIERLKNRREQRRNPRGALAKALHFGGPLLESSITLIRDGRFYYRGLDAVDLASERSFEEVAALVWQDVGADPGPLFPPRPPALPSQAIEVDRHLANSGPLERFQILLPLIARQDPASWNTEPSAVVRTGARVLRHLALLASRGVWRGSVVATLANGWGCDSDAARRLLETSLILCIDHELNVSSFTARCVASAGSTPYDVVLGGLSALLGHRHGGHTRRVEALLAECRGPDDVQRVMAERLQRGESLPGLGQVLYPQGDPRHKALRVQIERSFPDAEALAWDQAYVQAGRELVGEEPTVDLGLVLTARTLGLPPGTALCLFALGRSVGWIGHALEQYETRQLIRPRARYVGRQP